jgi:hypothetical protein
MRPSNIRVTGPDPVQVELHETGSSVIRNGVAYGSACAADVNAAILGLVPRVYRLYRLSLGNRLLFCWRSRVSHHPK